ncbi:MAG: lysophospholipid acyltransferase family protein [Rhodobacteraceae bacterium]|nr:lysophospholipid acyltransferase family protein [Paracoccaceae bacterium]
MGSVRAGGRFLALIMTVYGLLVIFLAVRLLEWPWGRPITPCLTCLVCRASLTILGIRLKVEGQPTTHPAALVANHISWLDILALNAPQKIVFVAKREVRSWFGIGILARATGTVFIERKPGKVRDQQQQLASRLAAGDRLLMFPEGTSTDGMQVLAFKSSLFAPFLNPGIRESLHIQPVTVQYRAPPGEDPRFFGWWGAIVMGPHLLRVLRAKPGGAVRIRFHQPIPVLDFTDRKALAESCERVVRQGLHTAGS